MTLESTKAEIERDREERQGFKAAGRAPRGTTQKRPAGAELVIPVDHPLRAPFLDVQRVKDQR